MELSQLKGYYKGGSALIVGGGISANRVINRHGDSWPWGSPDVVIGINGVIQKLQVDCWLCLEQDSVPDAWYMKACERAATIRVVNRLHEKKWPRCVYTRRSYDESDPRAVNLGLRVDPAAPGNDARAVGTSALSALHLAAYMGVNRISSIGVDLCFVGDQHHWYSNPRYGEMHPAITEHFLLYGELETTAWFLASAHALLRYKQTLADCGVTWKDYSRGLLQVVAADT